MSDPTNPPGPGDMGGTPPPPPPPPPPGGYAPPPPPPGAGYSSPGYGSGPGAGGPPLADVGKRGVAALVDYGIVFGGYIAILIVAGILGAISDVLGGLAIFVGYLGVIGFSIWNMYIQQGQTGQSIGKKMQGIKLVSQETGQPIGGLMAFVRYFVSGIPCGLGWVLMFFDPMRQQLGDKVSKSIVIDA